MFNKKDEKPSSFAKAAENKKENKNIGASDVPISKCGCGPECDCRKELLEELQKKNKEYLEGWKRERANFLNYKKDEMERIVALMKYANEELILRILPILDNFEIAFKNIPEDLKEDEHIKGLLQIHQQIKDFLKTQGVEEIKTAGGQFDPNFMEVLGEIEIESGGDRVSTEATAGTVVEEIQKGYTMNGKVIRPAKVMVTK